MSRFEEKFYFPFVPIFEVVICILGIVQNYVGACIQFRKIYFVDTETHKFLPELKGNKL